MRNTKSETSSAIGGVKREMRKLLLIILIPFVSALFVSAQSDAQVPDAKQWKEVRDNFYLTLLRLDTARKIISLQDGQIQDLNNRIDKKDTIIKELKLKNDNKDNEINLFKEREANTVIPPLIKWDGFYLNGITYYTFDPSNISNQFIKTLRWALSGEFIFKILDKLKLVLEPMLPIGDKFRIQAKAGWRLF